MFGLESMLKDDWNGYYSQGYMYFDNCSSLFLPKVCSTLTLTPAGDDLSPCCCFLYLYIYLLNHSFKSTTSCTTRFNRHIYLFIYPLCPTPGVPRRLQHLPAPLPTQGKAPTVTLFIGQARLLDSGLAGSAANVG